MSEIHRIRDITPIADDSFIIKIDGSKVDAVPGETVLSVMMAAGKCEIMENDHEVGCGAYCGMGVCHSCHVKINGRYKQRACQTVVEPEMEVVTNANKFKDIGIDIEIGADR